MFRQSTLCAGGIINLEKEFAITSVGIHENMVAYYASILSNLWEIDGKNIYTAALLHDNGKLLWHKDLFVKTKDKLTDYDYKIIYKHPIDSVDYIIKTMPENKNRFSSGSPSIFDIILCHHEKPDGTGYYKFADQPIESVIIAIADIFDACLSDRLYKKGLSINDSLYHAFLPYENYLILKGFDVKIAKKKLVKLAVSIHIKPFFDF